MEIFKSWTASSITTPKITKSYLTHPSVGGGGGGGGLLQKFYDRGVRAEP